MKRFHIDRLLFKCNAGKEKCVPVMDILRDLCCMMFSNQSIYMQMKTGTFSKNTIYHSLNDAKTNYQRFAMLLFASIICRFMKPLTDKKRRGCSRYLLSISVDIEKDGKAIPAKLVYIRNKSKRMDWLVLISTDTQLSEKRSSAFTENDMISRSFSRPASHI